MKQPIQTLSIGAAMGLLLLGAGCASSGPQRIQAGGPTAVTTMGVDLADFKNTAGQMVKELLVHPAIAGFSAQNGGKLPAMNIGKVINKSDLALDISQIGGRISEDMLNSGLVELVANDAGARDANAADAWESDAKNNKASRADFYLEGEIMMLAAADGRVREKTYTFQLRLNDRNRRTRWQRTVDVSKQSTRSSVGW